MPRNDDPRPGESGVEEDLFDEDEPEPAEAQGRGGPSKRTLQTLILGALMGVWPGGGDAGD